MSEHDIILPESEQKHAPLRCPVCGGNNLHHESAEFLAREEDAPSTRRTWTDGYTTASEIVPSERNPSGRRGAVVIRFRCEMHWEEGTVDLCVVQHKGNTFLWWRA